MARRKKLSTSEIEAQAIAIVRGEKQRWEIATAFVTQRVSFRMRQLISIFRKNYYGVFDSPIDPMTGQERFWYPLTEIIVEAVVKNYDVDQKHVGFRAKNENGYGITDLIRAYAKDKLSRMYFGQILDDTERTLAIDGTAVWKTWEEAGKLKRQSVDLLNIYIDPTSPSIQEAYRFTERSLMYPEEIAKMDWDNTADMHVSTGLPRVDTQNLAGSQYNSNVKAIDVYEMWGRFPKSLITGDHTDDNTEVEGHIVVSGIDNNGDSRCHLIEENTKKDTEGNTLKPYEECWYTRVPNRWYGRGAAEKVLMLQIYANIIFNVRINRARVSQLGLFKVRKGAGVTPQMLSRLPSNGVVVLNDLNDLEQLVVQEVGESSYKDEEVLNNLAQRLTNAFEVATGENMPASTPATNAALQSSAAKSGFAMIKDNIGSFLERWIDRHALPIWAKGLKVKDIIRMSTDDDGTKDIIETVVNYLTAEALDIHHQHSSVPSPQELMAAMEDARSQLQKRPELFMEVTEKIITDAVFTKVQITNEEMDVPVTIQNIIAMMRVAPQYSDAMVKEAFDLMGLGQPKAPPAQVQPQAQAPQGVVAPMAQPIGGPLAAQQLQALTTSANTMH